MENRRKLIEESRRLFATSPYKTVPSSESLSPEAIAVLGRQCCARHGVREKCYDKPSDFSVLSNRCERYYCYLGRENIMSTPREVTNSKFKPKNSTIRTVKSVW